MKKFRLKFLRPLKVRVESLVEFLYAVRGVWWRLFPPKCENCGCGMTQQKTDLWACEKCWND